MREGFVTYARKLFESDLWLSEKFTKGQAWSDMIYLANFRDGYFLVRNVRIDVKRGQLAYSELTLAKRWKWSRGKVRRFLAELESEKEQKIIQQKSHITSLITIINYDRYQLGGTTNKTTDGTHKKKNKEHIYRNSYFSIKKVQFEKYKNAYPGIDIIAEFKKMDAWLESNPKRRKKNYPRFINNWLNEALKQKLGQKQDSFWDDLKEI